MAEKIQILISKVKENEEINVQSSLEMKEVVTDALKKLVNELKDEICR